MFSVKRFGRYFVQHYGRHRGQGHSSVNNVTTTSSTIRSFGVGGDASFVGKFSYCQSKAFFLGTRTCCRQLSNGRGDGNSDDKNARSGHDDDSVDDDKEDDSEQQQQQLRPSTGSKFVPFQDEDSQTILDYHEQKYGVQPEGEELEESNFYLYRQRQKPGSRVTSWTVRRGKDGVYDIANLVDALRLEKMNDIAVIKVMPELRYCDHLVLATAMSPRHLNAVSQYIVKLHKMNRTEGEPFLKVQGDEKCQDWKVIDMNHIVLHLFLEETRAKYDIETLWCVGEQFDDKVQRPEHDPIVDLMEKHIKFLEDLQPIPPPPPPQQQRQEAGTVAKAER